MLAGLLDGAHAGGSSHHTAITSPSGPSQSISKRRARIAPVVPLFDCST